MNVISVARGQWFVCPTLALRIVSTHPNNIIIHTSSIIPKSPFCDVIDEFIIFRRASPLNGVPPQPSCVIESFDDYSSFKTNVVYSYVLTALAV